MSVRKEDYEDQIQVHIDECEKLRKENAELKEGVKSMFDMADIMKKLSAPLPAGAIQRTDKTQTRKGYDTTGFGYQYVTNRFNDVLGVNWGYRYEIIREKELKSSEGKTIYDITVSMEIWIVKPDDVNFIRECIGGHLSLIYVDAYKGAITNAFKKTAAFWGVGREAYEGSLDDDANYPAETIGKSERVETPKKLRDIPEKVIRDSKPSAVVISKEAQPDMTWTKFWSVVKNELGYTSKEAHETLGVFKMEEWLSQGKTLAEAIDELRGKKNLLIEDADEILEGFLENYP